jgi:hypothetical protein
MNIPKFSTNLGSKKVSMDEPVAKRANDLFSNNQNRQTTNIPYFSASVGTYYT